MKSIVFLLVAILLATSAFANPWEERERRGLETCFSGLCVNPYTHCCKRYFCRQLRKENDTCDTFWDCGCERHLTCVSGLCKDLDPGSGRFYEE